MRIASFLPSATEILFAIGAGEDVCAVTFECDFPAEAQGKPQVVFSHLPPGLSPKEIDAIVSAEGAQGRSLYFVDLPRLEALEPELIVLQDLCRVCAIDSPTLACWVRWCCWVRQQGAARRRAGWCKDSGSVWSACVPPRSPCSGHGCCVWSGWTRCFRAATGFQRWWSWPVVMQC